MGLLTIGQAAQKAWNLAMPLVEEDQAVILKINEVDDPNEQTVTALKLYIRAQIAAKTLRDSMVACDESLYGVLEMLDSRIQNGVDTAIEEGREKIEEIKRRN